MVVDWESIKDGMPIEELLKLIHDTAHEGSKQGDLRKKELQKEYRKKRKEEKVKDAERKRIADETLTKIRGSTAIGTLKVTIAKHEKKTHDAKKRYEESKKNRWNRRFKGLDKNGNAIHPRYRKNEKKDQKFLTVFNPYSQLKNDINCTSSNSELLKILFVPLDVLIIYSREIIEKKLKFKFQNKF